MSGSFRVLRVGLRVPYTSSSVSPLLNCSAEAWSSTVYGNAVGDLRGGESTCLPIFGLRKSESSTFWNTGCGGEDVGDSMRTDFFVFAGLGGVTFPTVLLFKTLLQPRHQVHQVYLRRTRALLHPLCYHPHRQSSQAELERRSRDCGRGKRGRGSRT
jgi:hypothetical protein